MGTGLKLKCKCGQLRGQVNVVSPSQGTHCACHCLDCQSFTRHLGRADVLGPRGETTIFQTNIWRVSIDQGIEQLRCLRLGPKGLFRWYAACCNTPLANTMPGGKMNFVGLTGSAIDPADLPAIGPVLCRMGTDHATGDGPELKNSGVFLAVRRLMWRTVSVWFRRGQKRAPFFDANGQPISVPHVLSLQERQDARAG